ncbi:MAG: DUF4835 family protein [Bacteroidales bacterium]|jgi:hypothetical protein|nr:DUF4835 family protein [Bacteroidales bacterium]
MKRIFGLIIVMLISFGSLKAQDFQCAISINATQISNTGNQQRYNELRQKLYSFIHERKWCQYNLKQNERIECSITINLTKASGDEYEGTATIVLQRPVYKASYKTTLMSFQDKKVKFKYADGDPLEYDENSNLSEITSLIAYYLNLFIAVELDSFSPNGGSPYFSKCQNIVNQNLRDVGWSVAESGQNNRYWITENFTNGTYSKIHDFYYQYHRLGLDVMYETPDAGRAVILESLKLLQQVNAQKSNLAVVRIILNTKKDEIINIFKEGMPSEKTQVINIMKQIDPTNASAYDAINTASK